MIPALPPDSDQILIKRIRARDQAAWTELYRRYQGRVAAYVRRRLKDHAAVEDVVQETFIGFSTSLATFDDSRDLQTWLFTIASHKVTDRLRRLGRRPVLRSCDGDEEALGLAPDRRQRPASSLARSAERRQKEEEALRLALRDYVADLVAKGDFVKLMALELIYVKGWRNQDVAARLPLSEQDVANLRFQAKKRLRERLIAAKLSADIFPELQGE